jgi:hypothetical protein
MTRHDQPPPRPSSFTAPAEDFADSPPKRSTVSFWLTITVLLLLGVVALLTYRALVVREPGAAVQVQANESWLGTQITLEARDDPSRKYIAYVDASGRHTVTFFVPPGRYALRVGAEDTPLLSRDIVATHGQPADIKLPVVGPGTRPATTTAPIATTGRSSP